MGVGAIGGNNVSFGIVARADLRAVDQTARALTGLSQKGTQAGHGIDRGMQQAARGMADAENRAERLRDTLGKVSTVGIAIGAGIFTGLGFAVKQASDLGESLSKTRVVFEGASDEVEAFAKTTASALGISRQQALETSATFGNLFRGMKIAPDAAADMSTALVTLSADLASFNNIDATQVLDDLRSGLVGETEPLRKYGVLLNEAAVQQELLRMGAEQINGEYTESQKVQARYNLILAQTTTAQGDFARTSDGAANSARIARAEIANAAASLGTALLPAVSMAAQSVGSLASAFNRLPDSVQSVAAIGLVAAGGLALVAAAAARLVVIGTTLAPVWTRVAGSFAATAASSTAATAGMTAAGAAATASSGGITALAVAEGRLTTASAAATSANAGLIASLSRLAAFGVISIGLVIAIDSITNAPSGDSTLVEKIAVQTVDALAGAIREVGGERIADALQDTVDEAEANMSGREFTLNLGFNLEQKKGELDQVVENFVGNIIPGAAIVGDKFIPDIQHADDVISELGITVGELQKQADDAGISFEDMLIRQADALGVTTPQIEAYKAQQKDATAATAAQTAAVEEQTASLDDQADTIIRQKREQEDLKRKVQDTLNAQFLASAAAKGLLLPYTRDAENAEEATAHFNRTLEEMQAAAINAARGIADISPELAGMQAGFGKVGDSLVDIFRKMDDAGVVDFTPAVREALDAVAALTKVEAKIEDVEAAITNNQQDLAMWEGRINLVTDTFGANSQQISEWLDLLQTGQITQEQFNANIAALAGSGGFPKLDALLAQGKITQQEYAAAVDAGTHLLQRSAGALQDEEAEIVRNIIALDGYVKKHDDADGAVKGLSETQRGFVAAMSDSKVQTYLQTLQLLFYLATIGQIPPEKVTEFIVSSGEADKVIDAVNRDLGLIPGEKSVVVSANVNNVIAKMQEVNGVIISTTADGATIEVFADTSKAATAFLELNRDELSQLDGRELIVKVKGDDGEWQTVKQEIINTQFDDKTVTVRAQAEAGLASIPVLGGAISQPNVAEVEQPEPVVFTAEDKVTPVAEAATASVRQAETDSGSAAAAAGQAIANGFGNGITAAQTAVANGLTNIAITLNSVGSGFYNYGFNPGYSFGVGVANGITATANAVFNAAFNVGYMAYLGTQAGMQAHSPSRLALQAGSNYGKTVADAIRSQIGNVRSAGEEMSRALQGTIADPMTNHALRGLLTVDHRPAAILAQSAGRGGDGSRSTVINQTNRIEFHGVTDTNEIVGHVTVELSRAWDRGTSAGVFGS